MHERNGIHGNHKHGLMRFFFFVSLGANVLLILAAGDFMMTMFQLKQVVSTKSTEIVTFKNDLKAVNDQAAVLLSRAQAAEGSRALAREELLKIATPDGKPRPLPSGAFKYAAEVRPVSSGAVLVRSFSEPNDIAKQYGELAPALKACDKNDRFGLDVCIIDVNVNTDFMDVLVVWENESVNVKEIEDLTRCLRRQPHIKPKGDRTLIDWVPVARYPGPCIPRPETTLQGG